MSDGNGTPPAPRRLMRGRDRMLGGVAGGIAEYFALDPTLVRILFVLFLLITAGAGGLVIYLVLWLIMPTPDDDADGHEGTTGEGERSRPDGTMVLGVVLLIFGGLLLLQRMPFFDWFQFSLLRFSWPVALIVLGLVLIIATRRR
ncbi:MAG: PspC domain-containing protein [Dehalococcoidia bacterium]